MKFPVSTPHCFPQYRRGEHLLDLGVHVAGLALGAVGVPVILVIGIERAGLPGIVGLSLYAAGLVAMLAFSAAYNLSRRPGIKEILRRFDRAAIFVMIAGTYSPFALAKIAGGQGLFAFVWSLALVGATLVFAFPRRSDRIALALYLTMGWSIVVSTSPLADAVPAHVIGLLIGGGVLYTVGVAFHLAKRLRYHNAVWHGCVLAAAGSHYVAVLDSFALAAP